VARWFFQKNDPTGATMFTVDVSIDTGRVCTNMISLDGPVDLSIHARFFAYLWKASISKAQSAGDSDSFGCTTE
jgi:hypothetical protein